MSDHWMSRDEVRGQGSPVVLIPGIQGHWQWMAPAVAALSAEHRVITFSLDGTGSVFDGTAARIDALLDAAAMPTAALVGVSFGGLLAAHYAATRPSRVSALVLVATPGPRWAFDGQTDRSVRHPWLAAPSFISGAIGRLAPEVKAALPTWRGRLRFAVEYTARVLRRPIWPPRMARWARDWKSHDVAGICRAIQARTLVITGERGLDRVVPVDSTREYLDLIPGARHAVLAGTGHVGLVLKPAAFARLVGDFIDAS
jgi:pimeloyl-ACP methyl ester carboxylesterase